MSNDDPGSVHLNNVSLGPMSNNETVERVGQDLSLTSPRQLHTNSMNMQTNGPLRIGLGFNQKEWLPMQMGFPGTVLDIPIQYGASQELSISNPSLSSFNFTIDPGTTSYFNQYMWSPNCFDALRSTLLPISDNSTTQAVPPSLVVSPSPSSSNLDRTGVMSEEENSQKMWEVLLQMVENNLLMGATIDPKSLRNLKFIMPKAAENKLLKNLNDPRYLETARKTFWLALKLKSCGFILALFRHQLLCTPNMVNAAYNLAMECQDLDLLRYLVTESVVDLSDYDPFAGTIIQDHFSDIDVEDTSDSWYKWHFARQKGEFHVSSLEFASMQQNPLLVQLLLHNKANPRTRPPNRSSYEASYDSRPINPLYCAISGRVPIRNPQYPSPGIVIDPVVSKNIIRILIEAGADVDSHSGFPFHIRREPTEPDFAPIYIAACRGEVEIVEYLLKNRAQVKKGSHGELALLGLLFHIDDIDESNSLRIAKMLIDFGIDVNLTQSTSKRKGSWVSVSYGLSAIDLAHESVQPEIIRLLNHSGAVIGETTLCCAIRGKNSNLIHTLLRSQVTLGNFFLTIYEALKQEMPDIAMHILSTVRAKHGPDFAKNLLQKAPIIEQFMETIKKAIELDYYDITHQLISIAEASPSIPGTSTHFHVTCVAVENDWGILASKLFKLAKYRKNIWEMDEKDWRMNYSNFYNGQLYPWKWHCRTIRFLLDAYIYPLSSETATIAIMVSAQDGDEKLVKRFLDLASEDPLIDVPATEEQIGQFMAARKNGRGGFPSLSAVISAGHLNIAYLLFEHGFEVDDRTFNIVVQKGNYNAFGHFLCAYTGCRREIDVEKDSIPILCAEEGKLLLENKLISAHNGIFVNPVPIAGWVISNGSLNLLIKVLKGFSRHHFASSEFLLNAAVELHRHEMLKETLRFFKETWGSPEGEFGQNALLLTFKDADMESMSLLLDFGVSPSNMLQVLPQRRIRIRNRSVLSFAIEQHSLDRQELLPVILRSRYYDTGDIVEEKNGMHNSPLLAAVVADNLYSVRLLIDFQYSVNEVPTRKTLRTPLQAACSSSSHAMIKFLVENGAEINAPAFELRGGTALQFAVIRGDYEIVYYLLNKGADLNAPRAKVGGRTAVEAAAEHGRVRILELFLSRGKTFDGEFGRIQYKRACTLAEKNGHKTVKWILEIYGIETGIKLLQPANDDGNDSDHGVN
jgi:ankyrin repeat protein